jgi:hypothetical protein
MFNLKFNLKINPIKVVQHSMCGIPHRHFTGYTTQNTPHQIAVLNNFFLCLE